MTVDTVGQRYDPEKNSVGQDKRDRNVRLASSLLEHIDNHPDLKIVSLREARETIGL